MTKYNEGDRVYTIDTNSLKVKEFEVGKITTWTTSGKTSVCLHPKGASYADPCYDESKCFASEKELLAFITTKDKQAYEAVQTL